MECDKIGYKTRQEANKIMAGMNRRKKQKYRLYPCNNCSLFHIATIKPLFKPFKDKYKHWKHL